MALVFIPEVVDFDDVDARLAVVRRWHGTGQQEKSKHVPPSRVCSHAFWRTAANRQAKTKGGDSRVSPVVLAHHALRVIQFWNQ